MRDLVLHLLALALLLPLVAWASGPSRRDHANDTGAEFRLGNEHAAVGKLEEAAYHFSKAALSEDRRLAARAHYNLGVLAGRQAQTVFGSEPVEASAEERQAGRALLHQAMVHYRDALACHPLASDARYNLELTQLWLARMQVTWRQHDRREARRRLEALETLAQLLSEQRHLRTENLALAEQPDSISRRELARHLGILEAGLSEEVATLREKIAQALEDSVSEWPEPLNPVSLSSQEEKDLETELGDLVENAQQEMTLAADRLRQGSLEDTLSHETLAVELLDEIHLGLVPFPRLLDESLQLQRRLVDQVAALTAEGNGTKPPDLRRVIWDQDFLARWVQLLPTKAVRSRQIWETVHGEHQDSEEALSSQEDFVPCAEKALAIAPKLQELTDQATVELLAERPILALARQREALALLEAVFALLPAQASPLTSGWYEPPARPWGEDEPSEPESKAAGHIPLAAPSPSAATLPEPRVPQAGGNRATTSVDRLIHQVRQRQQERRALERQFEHAQRASKPPKRDW